jgi:hypothetical protein
MLRPWRKRTALESALRVTRAEPRPEFVAAIVDRVQRTSPHRPAGSLRIAFAGGLTAALLVALASFGGLGYAAAGVSSVASSVQRATGTEEPRTVAGSAAQAQYVARITICHNTGSATNPTVTITISESALPAHRRHGDTIGPCPAGGTAGEEFTAGGRGGGTLGVSQSLPFTGFTIAFAFFAAFALISGGAALRRSARSR